MQKHQKDIRPDIITQLTKEDFYIKSALVKNVCLYGHRIDWKNFAILAIKNDYKKNDYKAIKNDYKILESFHIHKTDFSFNDKINSFYPELHKFINF